MLILSNLAISLDGKIATADRSHFYLGTEEDRNRMKILRKNTGAIVMGASTIRAFKRPCLAKDSDTHPINAIISHKLSGFDPDWAFFKSDKIKRIIYYSESPSREVLDTYTTSCELVHLNSDSPIASQIAKHLKSLGIKSCIVEGGGSVMWDFVSQNLIDEYHVTLTPSLVGGSEAPTLVDGKGFSAKDILKLKLVSHEEVAGEIFLVYRKNA
ncbi:MAG: RibD family protein [Xanthomonadaceae bacterium]|nr:RibD family protein [Xanthomonadaceae bacterium]